VGIQRAVASESITQGFGKNSFGVEGSFVGRKFCLKFAHCIYFVFTEII